MVSRVLYHNSGGLSRAVSEMSRICNFCRKPVWKKRSDCCFFSVISLKTALSCCCILSFSLNCGFGKTGFAEALSPYCLPRLHPETAKETALPFGGRPPLCIERKEKSRIQTAEIRLSPLPARQPVRQCSPGPPDNGGRRG